ncbi:hypothetical protein EV361DRAFT_612520 [Lentinula raphanica]|uniref:Uncharacterized protein n=1 Tax=Lentinula raphanica TaxID=153919 RepID=A0AA38P528_9AGAR|nr:hypothetical protein F5878DRAFT_264726 [Lentinula raphanica]KAJ3974704.1 hypothetical protein EV361DRAFT_612520 [Lentinula raphanica]
MSNSPESSGSNSTDPLFAYALCVYQTEGQNPDMQGYAVRLSNFIVNVCLGLLIRFSEENVADSVTVLLLQVYTLLICTFISLIRKQLSVADAHFALTSTVSPLALYLLYAALRTLLRRSSYLFRRLGDDNRTYLALSILMLPMWIVLNMLIYFADVFSGPSCPHITFENWLAFETEATIVSFVFASVFMGLIVLVWIVYFLRHFKDIRGEYRRHKMKAPHWKWFGWIRWFPLSFKSLMLAQWDVITKSHPWVLTLLIWTAYVIWGSSLLLYVTDIYELYYEHISQNERNSIVATYGTNKYKPSQDSIHSHEHSCFASLAMISLSLSSQQMGLILVLTILPLAMILLDMDSYSLQLSHSPLFGK